MSAETWIAILGTIAVLAIGTAVVIGLRWAFEWWSARPVRERPHQGTLERLERAGVLWLCALGVWLFGAAVAHYAPREGMFRELIFGLPELLGLLTYASRAAWGALVAAGIDAAIWPLFGPRVICRPPADGFWAGVEVPLRAVALAGWVLLYLGLIIGAAVGVRPVYDTTAPRRAVEAPAAVAGAGMPGR